MAYSKVTRAANGAAALNYVLCGKGHNGVKNRNEIVTAINMCRSISYQEQMEKYWRRAKATHKTQIIRIIQSFSVNEFDPKNSADILKANVLGQAFADEHYPDRQVLVCTQIDGEGGCVHNHILINDVSMTDCKGCDNEQYFHPTIMQWTNEVTKRFTIPDPGEKNADKLTQTERTKLRKGEYSYKQDIKKRVKTAMKKSGSEEDFFRNLSKKGISVRKRSSSRYGDFYTYELIDFSNVPPGTPEPKCGFKARSYKMGEDYGPAALSAQIEAYNRLAKSDFKIKIEEYAPLSRKKPSETDQFVSADKSEISIKR